MKRMHWSAVILAVVASLLSSADIADSGQISRHYRDGSVWNVFFIKIKDGMSVRYLDYVAADWRREQEELKKAGLIVSYKALTTEAHDTGDWNCMLMTEYRSLSAFESERDKRNAVIRRLSGDDAAQALGFKERVEIREVVGVRLAREIAFDGQN